MYFIIDWSWGCFWKLKFYQTILKFSLIIKYNENIKCKTCEYEILDKMLKTKECFIFEL